MVLDDHPARARARSVRSNACVRTSSASSPRTTRSSSLVGRWSFERQRARSVSTSSRGPILAGTSHERTLRASACPGTRRPSDETRDRSASIERLSSASAYAVIDDHPVRARVCPFRSNVRGLTSTTSSPRTTRSKKPSDGVLRAPTYAIRLDIQPVAVLEGRRLHGRSTISRS